MPRGAALLQSAVVAATDDHALVDEHGADGDTAFGEAELGFGDGGLDV